MAFSLSYFCVKFAFENCIGSYTANRLAIIIDLLRHVRTWIHDRHLCVWSKKVYNCGGTHKQLRQLLLFHTQRIKLIFSGLHSSWLIPFQRFSIKCTSPYFGNLVFIHTRWIRLQSWWQGSQFKSTHLMSATGQCSYKIQTVQFKSFQFSCEDKFINSLWKSLFLPSVGVLRHRTPHD